MERELFPGRGQWRDCPKNRKRWELMQRNEGFMDVMQQRGPLRCRYCGIGTVRRHWSDYNHHRSDTATVDHVIPRSKGGTDDPCNLVIACRKCNCQKGDRIL
ncbi:hypothetical protein FOA52_006516 [Chlamydomonas sp. UWO 241]|nr:hypothetical protein FOA52_006516 [Chlamydomonas sp. UWO 241]